MGSRSEEENTQPVEAKPSNLHFALKITGSVLSEAPLKVKISSDATVAQLKMKIAQKLLKKGEDLPPERQRLIFSGRMLQDPTLQLSAVPLVKKETTNFLHLAPLPKGASLTPRTKTEAKVDQLRLHHSISQRDRQRRSFHPYQAPTATRSRIRGIAGGRRTPPLPRSRHSLPEPRSPRNSRTISSNCIQRADPTQAASELVLDSASVLRRLHSPTSSSSQIGGGESPGSSASSTGRRISLSAANLADNMLLPAPPLQEPRALERTVLHDTRALLPLSQVLPSSLSSVLGSGAGGVPMTADDTVLLLEQVAHRSMILSLSLRAMSEANRQAAAVQQQQQRQRLLLLQAQRAASVPDLAPSADSATLSLGTILQTPYGSI